MEHAATVNSLYEGCKENNRQAQEMLYHALASKMLGVCMRYASSTFEAEDILQAGFVKVFTQLSSFRGEGSFEGWVRRVMVNTAIEAYRKNTRLLRIADMAEADGAFQQGYVIDELEYEDLLAIIRTLPEGYRVIFNMYVIEGYSHKEIAETLHISEGTSKSQLSRARSWLKEKIKQMEGGVYESK